MYLTTRQARGWELNQLSLSICLSVKYFEKECNRRTTMHIFITLFVESCFRPTRRNKPSHPPSSLFEKKPMLASTVRAQVWAIHKLRFREEGVKSKLMNWRKLWTPSYSKKRGKGPSKNHENLMTSFMDVPV